MSALSKLKSLCYQNARMKYGDPLPKEIEDRLEWELQCVETQGSAVSFYAAAELAKCCEDLGYLHGARGTLPSTLIAYLSGITETNPLPPHFYCPNCGHIKFYDAAGCGSGFDLFMNGGMKGCCCPKCGAEMRGDGHRLYGEMFFGLKGEKAPSFDLNIPKEAEKTLETKLREVFDGFVRTGKRDYRFYFPISKEGAEFLSDLPSSPKETEELTWEFSYEQHGLGSIALIPMQRLSMLALMEKDSGVPAKSIRIEEVDLYEFLRNDSLLGISESLLQGKEVIRKLDEAKDLTGLFSDYLHIQGHIHGTETPDEDGFPGRISLREDVFEELLNNGYAREEAFRLSELIRKGKGYALTEDDLTGLRNHRLERWVISFFQRVKYLFPKSHCVEMAIQDLRCIWYKVFYPEAFYAAFFSCNGDLKPWEYNTLTRGPLRATLTLNKDHLLVVGKDYSTPDARWHRRFEYMTACEALSRGIRFIPAKEGKSDQTRFLAGNGYVLLPMTSVTPVQKKYGNDRPPRDPFISFNEAMDEGLFQQFGWAPPEDSKKSKTSPDCFVKGFRSGISGVDRLMDEFYPNNIYTIAGRPASGRTSLMMQMAVHMAKTTGEKAYIFSTYHSAEELAMVALVQESGVAWNDFHKDIEKQDETILGRIKNARQSLSDLPIILTDSLYSANEIADAASFVSFKPGIIFVDQLQDLRGCERDFIDPDKYHQDVSRRKSDGIKRSIIRIKNTLRIKHHITAPIVFVSTIRREAEFRADHRPRLSDLRFDDLSELSDGVLLLYRDYYKHGSAGEYSELTVAKTPDGRQGMIPMHFNRETSGFSEKKPESRQK